MKQLYLNIDIPKTKHLTKSEFKKLQKERLLDILHYQNEQYFFTHLEELSKAINK